LASDRKREKSRCFLSFLQSQIREPFPIDASPERNKPRASVFASTLKFEILWRMRMWKRATVVLVGLVMALGVSAVIAQSSPIAARKALMKANNDNAKIAIQMMRGQAPFDAAKVDAAFAQWADTAQKLPGLFPDNSKTGEDTRATPKIWVTKSDFDAKAAAFAKAVAENRDKAKSSLDGLKAAIPVVGTACDNCHEDYRLTKQ
jgi:cytochrome c556